MTTKIYIPELWNVDAVAATSIDYNKLNNDFTRQDGNNYNSSFSKTYSDTKFLKLDGTTVPTADLDFNNVRVMNMDMRWPARDKDVTNVAFVEEAKSDVIDVIKPLFTLQETNILPVAGQIVTASSQNNTTNLRADNVFDGDPNTQWAISNSDLNSYVTIQVELPNPIQIHRVTLHPRTGAQKTTHIFIDYSFEYSVDGNKYETLFSSTNHIDQIRTFNFSPTKPAKYFRFSGIGRQHCGLAEIELFPAVLSNEDYDTKYLKLDGTNQPIGNLDMGFNRLTNVDTPVNQDDVSTKGYTDNTYLKLDGTNTPTNNIDLNNNSIINLSTPVNSTDSTATNVGHVKQSATNIVREFTAPMFVKSPTSAVPNPRQVVAASSHHGTYDPLNAFDGKSNTQYVINKSEANKEIFIRVKLPDPIQICEVELHPRTGAQKTTHCFTHYYFEISNDDNTYETVFESTSRLDQIRVFNFSPTTPATYFRLRGTGQQQFGVAQILIYEAILISQDYLNLNYLNLDGSNKPSGNIDMNSKKLTNLADPTNNSDAVTKSFLDQLLIATTNNVEAKTLLLDGTTQPTQDISWNNKKLFNLADPTNNLDAVNKKYVDDNMLSKAVYETNQALPGIPVTSGLTLTFIPNLKSCLLDLNGKVISMTDPFTQIELNGGSTLSPTIKIDSNNLYYLEFDGVDNILKEENVSVGQVGGQNGNTTTLFFIANTKIVKQQNNFGWKKATGTNTYDWAVRISAHMPWEDDRIIIDHGNYSGGRTQKYYTGNISRIVGTPVCWAYRRDVSVADIWLNGVHEANQTQLTTALNSSDVGQFQIGENCTMDFYGLFFYNRALNDNEMFQMNLFARKLFNL